MLDKETDPRYNGDLKSFDPENPVEVRAIPGTPITLRVLGYVFTGPMENGGFVRSPVIYGPDADKYDEYLKSKYRCLVCLDAQFVYTHGENKEPDVSHRGPGEPCMCVHKFDRDWWQQIGSLPDVSDAVKGVLRSAVSAWINGNITPDCSKTKYDIITKQVGKVFMFGDTVMRLVWQRYDNVKDDAGRVRLEMISPPKA